jgi:cobaltochelatase CobS
MSQATTSQNAAVVTEVPFTLSSLLPMTVFGENSSKTCPAFPLGHMHQAFVRPKSSFYKFRTSIRMPVMNWLFAPGGDSLALTGPTGSGKTSLIREIAAILNWPYLQANAHSRMEIPELIGNVELECDPATGDQRTVFRHGPLAQALRDGFIFCLDEGDLLDPAVMAGLNAILEGGPLMIGANGGEIIHPHPMFRFVITCNTRGQGDELGLYGGAQAQNLATWDRYRMVEVPYMTEADEIETITHVLGSKAGAVVKTMVQVANEVRKQFVGNPAPDGSAGNLTVTFSTRTLLRWARVGTSYTKNRAFACPMAMALRESLTNRADVAQRIAIHTIAKDKFGAESWKGDDVLVAVGVV